MNQQAVALDELCINVIRGLAMDAVQKANCGHPGMPMGAAPMAYALWRDHLVHNPKNPKWFNRDRFILSAGHGSMLLYSLLHLSGYDLSLEEIKNFRQWGSKTPGHPENFLTPGVEVATGPLGQGISMAVGMAVAERFLAAKFNDGGDPIVDHHTYVIASDGDLMEGVASEACSFAGHQRLGKLIVLYDSNEITIDGRTEIAFGEDVGARFRAYGWNVDSCDGMDWQQVSAKISAAKKQQDAPTLIVCRTVIGYGSPNRANTSKSHGEPLGAEEVKLSKAELGLPETEFFVPEEALREFRSAVSRGDDAEAAWRKRLDDWKQRNAGRVADWDQALSGLAPADIASDVPKFEEKLATRAASGKVLNAIAPRLSTLVGGSADLAGSNNSTIAGEGLMQLATPGARNIAFGVREHGMAAIVNGMTLHGGVRAYGASFLIFSDYCRPALRLAALQHCPSIFIFTHDSIGLGEDGPTHQPIEQLASLRAIPNLDVMRPCDGNEAAACWVLALKRTTGPSLLALSRQAVPVLSPAYGADHPAHKGAYVLQEASNGAPERILIGTGTEVQIAVAAAGILEGKGVPTRVVSMPSWFTFEQQSGEYKQSVLVPGVRTVSIEAGATLGWERYADAAVGLDHFGASAPADVLYREFGITAERLASVALAD